MTTITKERMREYVEKKVKTLEFSVSQSAFTAIRENLEMELEMARMLLASMGSVQEPVSFDALRDSVAEMSGAPAMEWGEIYKGHQPVPFINFNSLSRLVEKFRAAPQPLTEAERAELQEYRKAQTAPVVDGDLLHSAASAIEDLLTTKDRTGAGVWFDLPGRLRRAAMLKSEPVSNRDELPDGWVMVPKEPTEDMIVEGFESWPDEFFSDTEVWEAYQEMSGCQQAAHRAKLCWAAMIAAAPQQESE